MKFFLFLAALVATTTCSVLFAGTIGGTLADGPVNVKDFGAMANGLKDDTVAFRLAFAASKVVMAPPGDYVINGAIGQPGNSKLILGPGTYTLGNAGTFGQPSTRRSKR